MVGWGAYAWDKIPQQDFVLKMQWGGGGGGGLFVGHYGTCYPLHNMYTTSGSPSNPSHTIDIQAHLGAQS